MPQRYETGPRPGLLRIHELTPDEARGVREIFNRYPITTDRDKPIAVHNLGFRVIDGGGQRIVLVGPKEQIRLALLDSHVAREKRCDIALSCVHEEGGMEYFLWNHDRNYNIRNNEITVWLEKSDKKEIFVSIGSASTGNIVLLESVSEKMERTTVLFTSCKIRIDDAHPAEKAVFVKGR